MRKDLFIFNDGELSRKENTLLFKNFNEDKKKFVPINELDNIYVFGELDLNKRVLEFLSQKKVCVHFFNYYGYYSGSYYPREHLNSGYILLKQCEYYTDNEKRINIAKKIIIAAIENILQNIKYYNKKNKEFEDDIFYIQKNIEKIKSIDSINVLMAIEGNTREYYYKCFNKIIEDKEFYFENRTKRPPKDKINSLISFGNSLMYSFVLSEIYKTHLDPRIGYLHSTNERRFTLNLDIAEIFKPVIVDRIIFSLINKKMLDNSCFLKEFEGVLLNEKGRKIFLEQFNKKILTVIKHPKLKKEVSYKRIVRMELYKLSKHITEDEEYSGFVGGW
jgi:CRISPR-associated protein Cas1